MAIYKYSCADCSKVFNIEATIREKEEGNSGKFACPSCKSKNIVQSFSAVNFLKNIFASENKSKGCCSGEKKVKESPKEEKKCCGGNNNGGCHG